MTALKDTPLYGFHIATTALDNKEARVVAASIVGASSTFNLLIDPGVPIPESASNVHGITADTLAHNEHENAHDGLDTLITTLENVFTSGGALVGFNIVYDLTVLEYEARRHNVTPLSQRFAGLPAPVIDTRVIHVALEKYHYGKRTMPELNEELGLVQGTTDTLHAFAEASVALLYRLAARAQEEKGVDMGNTDASTVSNWCAEWYQDQNQNFADYLRTREFNRVSKVDGIESGYPVTDVSVGLPNFDYNQSW